jgi:hypothetical protein
MKLEAEKQDRLNAVLTQRGISQQQLLGIVREFLGFRTFAPPFSTTPQDKDLILEALRTGEGCCDFSSQSLAAQKRYA